jgi:hypothetical protein
MISINIGTFKFQKKNSVALLLFIHIIMLGTRFVIYTPMGLKSHLNQKHLVIILFSLCQRMNLQMTFEFAYDIQAILGRGTFLI